MRFHLTVFVAMWSCSYCVHAVTIKPEKTSVGVERVMLPTDALLYESSHQAVVAMGGGITSVGGTDSPDVRLLTAWFYGSEPIATCYLQSENFGASRGQSERAIRHAIRIWQKYFTDKKIKSRLPAASSINLNFDFRGRCRGGEDLALFFGTGPIFANLSDLKTAQLYHRPYAFVNKTHMSQDLRWAKGYIRIMRAGQYNVNPLRPDWSQSNALDSIVLHELGHVLGFVHKE